MPDVLAYIGRNTFGLYRYFAGLYEMTAKAVYWTFVAPFEGRKLEWGYAIHQFETCQRPTGSGVLDE